MGRDMLPHKAYHNHGSIGELACSQLSKTCQYSFLSDSLPQSLHQEEHLQNTSVITHVNHRLADPCITFP